MALTNNDVFKKLRVAHQLTNDDIVEICALADFKVSKSELGAIFRKEGHPKYMECGDQFLRNFLDGLIIHLRGPMEPTEKKKEVVSKDKTGSTDKKQTVGKKPDSKEKSPEKIKRPRIKNDSE